MMLAAKEIWDGAHVLARDAIKGHEYACRMCTAPVVLKQGELKTAHYAHRAKSGCEYAGRESELHQRAKYEIYDALRASPRTGYTEIERPMGEVRPDIYAVIQDRQVAIEVQASVLTMEKIAARTSAYARLGVHVLWLDLDMDRVRKFLDDKPSPGHLEADDEVPGHNRWVPPYEPRYAPRSWERWLHELYYGNVFFYELGSGTILTRVRFGAAIVSKDGGYDKDGDYHGGYDYTSKRWRTPKIVGRVDLLDLRPKERDAWQGTVPHLPKARIMMAAPRTRR